MTEVETAKLLFDLSAVAAKLNTESNSLNEILDAWEAKLRALNIGLEAWVIISSEQQTVEVEDEDGSHGDTKDVPGSVELQLGWVKFRDDWKLLTRGLTYRGDLKDNNGWPEQQEIGRSYPQPVHDASREVRIEALEALPKLLERLKTDAEAAVGKITRAKKLVK